jgi:hypothetical protein
MRWAISARIESSKERAARTSIAESVDSESKSCLATKEPLSLTELRIYRCPLPA